MTTGGVSRKVSFGPQDGGKRTKLGIGQDRIIQHQRSHVIYIPSTQRCFKATTPFIRSIALVLLDRSVIERLATARSQWRAAAGKQHINNILPPLLVWSTPSYCSCLRTADILPWQLLNEIVG